jgi:hypothetical protein
MKFFCIVAATTMLLFVGLSPSPVFACGEGSIGTDIHFFGSVKNAATFQKDITQHYYFATSIWGQKVKVPSKLSPSIYFWLVPQERGWEIRVAPTKDTTPDYIAITTWPNKPTSPLSINSVAPPKQLAFCFNNSPQDYAVALNQIQKTSESGMVESFNMSCNETDKVNSAMGHGLFRIIKASATELKFSVNLKVPIYFTDCAPP